MNGHVSREAMLADQKSKEEALNEIQLDPSWPFAKMVLKRKNALMEQEKKREGGM